MALYQLSAYVHDRMLEHLETYLEIGGLPEVVTTHRDQGDWQSTRENLLLGYYHDFKRACGEERQAYFIAAMKATAYLLGSPFKNSHVAALLDGGKNQEIIKSLGQLESWKIIHPVEQKGPASEHAYHSKRYLFDMGIAKQLRESATPTIRLIQTRDTTRTSLGGTIENAVINTLVADLPEITGWKKSASGSEVDFVVKKGNQTIPIECKATLSVKNSQLGGIRDFMRRYKTSIGVVVSLAPFEVRPLPEGVAIIILPLYLMEQWQEILSS